MLISQRRSFLAPGRPGPRRGRPAAAAVEFALASPLLVAIIVGMFEMSRGLMVKQVLSDAARKACRTGAGPGVSNSSITAEVTDVLTDNGIDATAATTTITVNGNAVDASTAQQGDKISVKVSIPVSKVYWAGMVFFSSGSIESEAVVMMRLG